MIIGYRLIFQFCLLIFGLYRNYHRLEVQGAPRPSFKLLRRAGGPFGPFWGPSAPSFVARGKNKEGSQNGPKIVLIMVPKLSQNGPEVVLKWSQSGPNVVKKWSQRLPKVVPKWSQSGPKMVPKWSQSGSKMVPKWSQNGPKVVPK